MSELSVVGGIVFGDMFNVLAWGVFVSLIAIVLATLAEGRGSHAMKLIMALKHREGGIDLYETLPRDEDDWRLLAKLAEVDYDPRGHADGAIFASGAIPVRNAIRPERQLRVPERRLRVPERSSAH